MFSLQPPGLSVAGVTDAAAAFAPSVAGEPSLIEAVEQRRRAETYHGNAPLLGVSLGVGLAILLAARR